MPKTQSAPKEPSHLSLPSFPSGVHFHLGDLILREIPLRLGVPSHVQPSAEMLYPTVSRPSSSCTSLDDDECSFPPFRKCEKLLAQMKQKKMSWSIRSSSRSVFLPRPIYARLLIILSRLSLPSFIIHTSPRLSRSRHAATQRLLPTNTDKM